MLARRMRTAMHLDDDDLPDGSVVGDLVGDSALPIDNADVTTQTVEAV